MFIIELLNMFTCWICLQSIKFERIVWRTSVNGMLPIWRWKKRAYWWGVMIDTLVVRKLNLCKDLYGTLIYIVSSNIFLPWMSDNSWNWVGHSEGNYVGLFSDPFLSPLVDSLPPYSLLLYSFLSPPPFGMNRYELDTQDLMIEQGMQRFHTWTWGEVS